MRIVARLLRALVAAGTATVGLQTAYLLALAGAAAVARRRPGPPAVELPQLLVFVPAHDEERMIEPTVRSLLDADYPRDRRTVIVIADNCVDRTAVLAEAAGATVWVRQDSDRSGKGQALAWALARARTERPPQEAVAMIDADCVADLGLLRALGARLSAGADAVQAAYVGSNPDEGTAAALRHAGFALMNFVRPAGKDALGLSVGLLGSGMAFAPRTLQTVPWEAFSVTEDREYHLRLVAAAQRVRFAPEAAVRSPMPTTTEQGQAQQVRWETGNVLLARRWAPRLLRHGVRDRDAQTLHAGLELLVPPLSLVVAPVVPLLTLAALLRAPRIVRAVACVALGQVAYVVVGLRVAGVPPAVWHALAAAPRLIALRVAQYARLRREGGATHWERTDRG